MIYDIQTIPEYLREFFSRAPQLGLEPTPAEYVAAMVEVFAGVWRVLRDDGTLWLNLGDSYAGSWGAQSRGVVVQCAEGGSDHHAAAHEVERGPKARTAGSIPAHSTISANQIKAHPKGTHTGSLSRTPGLKAKDLVGIPWMVAFALRDAGWYLRSDIIWCLSGGAKVYARTQKGDMPVPVKDLVRLDPSTVKLWNGEKWTQVLGWSKSPEPRDGALEIELRSGERIGCTPGHEWPTQRGNVRADALLVGDVIQTTTLPEPARPAYPSMLTGVDDDVAWLCGLYLAEGSMSGDTVQLAGHANQTDMRMRRIERIAAAFHGTARAHVSENRASIHLNGPVIQAVVRAYIHGDSAKNKGLKVRVWQRGNSFLRELLAGYLEGDGHYDAPNDRWRLGFTRNDRLAADLRTLAARLGLSMRLAACTVTGFGREWPAYRGDVRLAATEHPNARAQGEVVAIRASRAREFWDIGVEDEPHLFALASGVLTHNSKPNPMPESVTDRPTKAHEYIFLLSKSARYYYDAEAIREEATCSARPETSRNGDSSKSRDPRGVGVSARTSLGFNRPELGRNKRTVWTVTTQPYPEAHFATYPEDLITPCILAGSRPGDLVLDPFTGSGTTGAVAIRHQRSFVGCELNPEYVALARRRIGSVAPMFAEEVA